MGYGFVMVNLSIKFEVHIFFRYEDMNSNVGIWVVWGP